MSNSINDMKLSIPTGGMYQEWCLLSSVVEKDAAMKLEKLASEKGWRIISQQEAIVYGFDELANWSVPKTDVLVYIDETFLVCLPRNDFQSSEN